MKAEIIMSSSLTAELELDRPAKDELRVRLSGPLDLRTVPRLRGPLLRNVRARTGLSVDLELAGVTRMDTAGAALLLEIHRIVTTGGGKLRLDGTGGEVGKVLKLNQLDAILQAG